MHGGAQVATQTEGKLKICGTTKGNIFIQTKDNRR